MSVLWGVFNSYIALVLYFCVLLLASLTWLRRVPLPISRWAWSAFGAFVVDLGRGLTQTACLAVAMNTQANAFARPMIALRLGLQFVVWLVVVKVFFRKAGFAQVLITTIAGTAVDALLLSRLIALFLHASGAIRGG